MTDDELGTTGEYHKNEKAWELVFDAYPQICRIDGSDAFELNSKNLKTIGKREPRLMAKIESRETLPEIFRKNNLCILPNKSRGSYTIGHFDAFEQLDYTGIKEESIPIADHRYDTLNPCSITKEPSLILSAFNYGILDRIADDQQVKMTNFGRESTPEFEFTIDNIVDRANPYTIEVNRSQLEMDGVFESEDYVINIEAKMVQRSNFLARQLYYPFRLLNTQTEKKILNVFMTYSESGSVCTHVYSIQDDNCYNSFNLISAVKYNFFEELSIREISGIIYSTEVVDDRFDCIFPQADSMDKIFDAIRIISSNPGIIDFDLAYTMSVTGRQGGYYGNACEYLGLTYRVRDRNVFRNHISPLGKSILESDLKSRNMLMIRCIVRHRIFNVFARQQLECDSIDKAEIAKWIGEHYKVNDSSTSNRRSSTVKRWIDWIFGTVE